MSNYLTLSHGLSLTFTREANGSQDVWINFKSEEGKAASLSVAAMAERNGTIIGNALKAWALDRLEEYHAEKIKEEEEKEEKLADGQFGAGG